MTYPILNTEHENKFQELTSKLLDLKSLEGPIYSVESKHHFQEIDKKVDSLKEMNYPIRDGVNPYHMYGELQQNLTEIKTLGILLNFLFKLYYGICSFNCLTLKSKIWNSEIFSNFFSWTCL